MTPFDILSGAANPIQDFEKAQKGFMEGELLVPTVSRFRRACTHPPSLALLFFPSGIMTGSSLALIFTFLQYSLNLLHSFSHTQNSISSSSNSPVRLPSLKAAPSLFAPRADSSIYLLTVWSQHRLSSLQKASTAKIHQSIEEIRREERKQGSSRRASFSFPLSVEPQPDRAHWLGWLTDLSNHGWVAT